MQVLSTSVKKQRHHSLLHLLESPKCCRDLQRSQMQQEQKLAERKKHLAPFPYSFFRTSYWVKCRSIPRKIRGDLNLINLDNCDTREIDDR